MRLFFKPNDKPKPHERHVKANDREFNGQFNYADNSIKTSRYTLMSFVPLNLFEQFQRLANIYFLGLLILKCMPYISSLTPITTAFPLLVVLGTTAVKDGYDDYHRHLSDKKVNNRIARIVRNGAAAQLEWRNIRVGDVVRLQNNEPIPADVLILSSSYPNGSCFVETSELDGETNLKCRQCLKVTAAIGDDEQSIWSFDAEAITELPNNQLYKFEGHLNWRGVTFPLTNCNILLRGCVLRNTQWCYGLVLFSGSDTKIMKNNGKVIHKLTAIDRMLNKMVVGAVIILVSMCITCVIGKAIWESGHHVRLYLPWDSFIQTDAVIASLTYCILAFASYIIVLNTVIPISLYVTVEVIRLAHSLFIYYDDEMVDLKTGKSAEARSSTLNEDLGQVEYIFSDKTGTLTENVMEFKRCSIDGVDYGESFDCNLNTGPGGGAYCDFFRTLAVCHTAMPAEENGELVYQAQSPDEKALLTGSRKVGFVFKERTSQSIAIEARGVTETYSVLATLAFDNVRKRMSVILRCPDGKVRLFCKGSDTSILDNLAPGQEDIATKTNQHVTEYAIEGLRTLCISYRDIDETYFGDWNTTFTEAVLANHHKRVSELTETIEKNLILAGATGIEDKLQDGVPQTIEILRSADIKFWILTGDKKETAVNIAYSCRLFSKNMAVCSISGDDETTVEKQLQELGNLIDSRGSMRMRTLEKLESSDEDSSEDGPARFGMVINGKSLAYALNPSVEETFSNVAMKCDAVVCCRATPVQKSMVVDCIKSRTGGVTLAIGDGANDVPMIETANIGIGINGQEGAQAVLASDYSIPRFMFLQRLLLIHGRLSYLRIAKYLRYFFYKTFAASMGHFWFAFACGFSAQAIYSGFFIAFYNVCYTSLPVLALGIFERDVDDKDSIAYPKLYTPGQKSAFFNTSKFLKCVIHGTITSIVAFFVTCMAFKDRISQSGYAMDDTTIFENVFATLTMHAVTVQALISSSYQTVFSVIAILWSYTFFYISLFCYDFIISGSFYSGLAMAIKEPTFWLALGLVDTCLYVPTLAWGLYKNLISPTLPTRIKMARRKMSKVSRKGPSFP